MAGSVRDLRFRVEVILLDHKTFADLESAEYCLELNNLVLRVLEFFQKLVDLLVIIVDRLYLRRRLVVLLLATEIFRVAIFWHVIAAHLLITHVLLYFIFNNVIIS